MKRLHGAAFGVLLLAAPAVALAGNGGGGGGLAGAGSRPVTAAIAGPATNQSDFAFARTGATPYTDASGGTQLMTGAYQSQAGNNAAPINNAMSLANQRGGGH